MLKSFKVIGRVQGVMFRQTFIRGLQRRNIRGGATNIGDTKKTVDITIESSDESKINEIINLLKELKIINSWNASVESIIEMDIIPIENHEVTTENVDQFKWSSGVDFYF
tara:strand:- start:277 stop:606 length:330 start_codon:yes stop_codon:yes gene_type:complete